MQTIQLAICQGEVPNMLPVSSGTQQMNRGKLWREGGSKGVAADGPAGAPQAAGDGTLAADVHRRPCVCYCPRMSVHS